MVVTSIAMRLEFEVDGKTIEFHRNWFTGSARFVVDGVSKSVADPAEISTHFSVSRVNTWTLSIFGRRVEVKKTRPLLFAGFRPQHYVVSVDGKAVAERTGY